MSNVHVTLDEGTTIKPTMFTAANADAIVDGLGAHASPGKQFDPRLIPGVASGQTVTFTPTNSLTLPKSGRTYLVTLSWPESEGKFLPFGPVSQRPTCSNTSLAWAREDSRTRPTQITWEVYLPTLANYTGLTMSATAVALGNWSRPDHLAVTGTWSVSEPLA